MKKLKDVTSYFSNELSNLILSLDNAILDNIQEIRIRKDKTLVLIVSNNTYFLTTNGSLANDINNGIIIEKEEFENTFSKICDYSVYSKAQSLIDGFVTLPSGARVGICSTAVYKNGELINVKDVVSLMFRIPSESRFDLTDINTIFYDGLKSIIVAGAPACGKTTLIRQLAYQLSSGAYSKYYKVTLIDERNELAGKYNDEFSMSVGVNTDVLTGFSKKKGIEIAVRTLSPNLIVCDEISTLDELKQIKNGFASGVSFIVSIHSKDYLSLFDNRIAIELINTNCFDYILFLSSDFSIKLIKVDDVKNEMYRYGADYPIVNSFRNI